MKIFLERLHDDWIKMRPGQRLNMGKYAILRPSRAVGTMRTKRVPDIDDRENVRGQRDFLAFQTTRVAGPVHSFVVAIGDFQRG